MDEAAPSADPIRSDPIQSNPDPPDRRTGADWTGPALARARPGPGTEPVAGQRRWLASRPALAPGARPDSRATETLSRKADFTRQDGDRPPGGGLDRWTKPTRPIGRGALLDRSGPTGARLSIRRARRCCQSSSEGISAASPRGPTRSARSRSGILARRGPTRSARSRSGILARRGPVRPPEPPVVRQPLSPTRPHPPASPPMSG